METMRLRWIPLLLALTMLVPARAQTVSDYFFFKGSLYTQTSAAGTVPLDATPYYFHAGINGSQVDLINPAPSFTGPGSVSGTLTQQPATAGTHWDHKAYFGTKAELDAAYPNGAYNLAIPGLSPSNGLPLSFSATDAYSVNRPEVTNTNLPWVDGKLVINLNTPTTLTFTSFTEFLNHDSQYAGFRQVLAFFPLSSSVAAPAWRIERSNFGDDAFTEFQINPADFVSGQTYRTVLTFDVYSSLVQGDNTTGPNDIAHAEGVAMFSHQLQFYVTAVPEPSTVALSAGAAALAGALWWRRRQSARLNARTSAV